MQLNYSSMKLPTLAEFKNPLTGNFSKQTQVESVYNDTIACIDLESFVKRYNALETNGPVSDPSKADDLNRLIIELQEITNPSVTGRTPHYIHQIKNRYSDPNVAAPAQAMLARLDVVKKKAIERRTYLNKRGPVKAALDNVREGWHKVVAVKRSFTKPADDLYDIAEKAISDGGSNIYESIANWGKHL